MSAFRGLIFSAASFLLTSCVTPYSLRSDFNDSRTNLEKKIFSFGEEREDSVYIGIEIKLIINSEKRDRQYKLEYPEYGGGTITHIRLIVQTESGECDAMITEGGLDQENLVITLNTYSTSIIGWTAEIYGVGQNSIYIAMGNDGIEIYSNSLG